MTAKNMPFTRSQEMPGAAKASDLRRPASRSIAVLDKMIAGLMAAIVLTLAWPVSMALWGQSRSSHAAGPVCMQLPSNRARSPDRPLHVRAV